MSSDLLALMTAMGRQARAASLKLAQLSTESKNLALRAAAQALRDQAADIKAANALDMAAGHAKGLDGAMLDRLMLDDKRIEAMAKGLDEIALLPDPVGRVMDAWERPNGLRMERIAVPLGVVGIIYESRPNVTADASALCLKSGNAVILRGGSESFHSSQAVLAAIHAGLDQAGLDRHAIQMVPTPDRQAVGILLTMSEFIDVLVPRGGKSLIKRVREESRIPLFQHLDGNCHTYVDATARLEMARAIVINAKMRRTGICGATETLLVDRQAVASHLPVLVKDLLEAGCEVRGDALTQAVDARVCAATDEDWHTEYLDAIIAVKVVDGVEAAVDHINSYGSAHTEAIVTEDAQAAERFLRGCHSAICLWNASTQFADGGEFGMGAEIGISTGKLHARGPVGLEQLCTMKYLVRGHGQVRPG
jgi:glutamate-5-semialdehyde dehydrogenase